MRRVLSLERKLPLLMTGVLVIVIASSLALTYVTLVQSAREAMFQRLGGAARELASLAETNNRTRATLAREVTLDPAISRALALTTASDSAAILGAARTALHRMKTPTDSQRTVELWSADGRRVTYVGEDLRATVHQAAHPSEGPSLTGVPVSREGLERLASSDSMQTGSFYEGPDGHVYYWNVIPVLRGQRHVGYIAHQRRIGTTSQSVRSLRELMGSAVRVLIRNDGPDSSARWLDLGAGLVSGPVRRERLGEGFIHHRANVSEPILAAERPVRGTPWSIVLEVLSSAVLSRARSTLITISFISLALLAAGVVVAWLISRRVTRPIVSLTTAIEAVARGEYASRVDHPTMVASGDEVARLAIGFNHMASEVDASRQLLRRQVEEAHTMTGRLEQANAQLVAAMLEAREARDAAERANRAKSDFLAVMSHELRTPLNAIGGYAQLIELGIHGPVSDAQRDALARIARSQAHLLGLINDVLNFAKIDAGQVQYVITDVPLDATLAELETMVAPQVSAKRLHLIYEPCDAALTARADREKLQQIVLNLLTNAIKFTPEGGRIRLRCTADDQVVGIRVEDTGIGISADRLHTVFDPFVQVDRSLHRPHEGVGLGLAISRDLARGMGGDLHAESEPARGSVFVVMLSRRTGQALTTVGREAATAHP